MARKSWTLQTIQKLEEIAAPSSDSQKAHKFLGSVRMTYTICAFLSMVVHICLRNTLSFVILCMVKHNPDEVKHQFEDEIDADSVCGAVDRNDSVNSVETGYLMWTRSQALTLQGTFYYGYIFTLPFAGRLSDKFGGKLFFMHSITTEAIVFIVMPFFARWSYTSAVVMQILQGLFAGCGNPSLYQLFVVWAHPTERTALISFAYGGYAVGALISYISSSYLCRFGWEMAFYVLGSIGLLFGISCQWLVYNKLEEHPRLSKEEFEYLQSTNRATTRDTDVPWKSIFTSQTVYAFIFTHVFHTYGIIVLTLMMPRFLKEAMRFSLQEVGILSSAPFFGSLMSKALSIIFCRYFEKKPSLNLTIFRRFIYVSCNIASVACIGGIIYASCLQKLLVIAMTIAIGVTTDLGFAGVYWPSLLFFAPSYAGLLSGIANCLANCCGFLAPIAIAAIVQNGSKHEWNYVLVTLIAFYILAAAVFGMFSSSKLQSWDQRSNNNTQQQYKTSNESNRI